MLWFQSLFCWKSVWEYTILELVLLAWQVSILVLLEIGLGAALAAEIEEKFIGFNPCFVGNRSGRLPRRSIMVTRTSFNPCFVGNRSGSSDQVVQAVAS